MRDYQEELNRLTRVAIYLRVTLGFYGFTDEMAMLLYTAQQIIKLEARLVGQEVYY